jgi:hypothetical protein
MEVMMAKVQPGLNPHYFVVHTLGSLATANPLKIVPYLKSVLTAHLSLLSGIRSDAMKQAYAYSKSLLIYYIQLKLLISLLLRFSQIFGRNI